MHNGPDGNISDNMIHNIDREIQIVSSLHHQNVYKIRNYGSSRYFENDIAFINTQYLPNGELFDLIDLTGPLSEKFAR